MLDSRPQNKGRCWSAVKSLGKKPPTTLNWERGEPFLLTLSELHGQCHLDSDAALHTPAVEGRWVTRLRHVSVNQVEDRDAPASISTRISFSIPRIESANLRMVKRWRDISLEKSLPAQPKLDRSESRSAKHQTAVNKQQAASRNRWTAKRFLPCPIVVP